MTPEQWQTSADPTAMLAFLRGRLSPRKLRLVACAICRQLPPAPDDPDTRERENAVSVAERFADGLASVEELAEAARCSYGEGTFWSAAHADAFEAADFCSRDAALQGELALLASLVRDIAGDPFRPPDFDPAWRTADVLRLARAVYEERDGGRLPILADALEEAGCADAELLGHLRGPGPHVRGCWPVDLVLGRE